MKRMNRHDRRREARMRAFVKAHKSERGSINPTLLAWGFVALSILYSHFLSSVL